MNIEFKGKKPQVDASVFVAPTSAIVGDVAIGEASSVWFGAVIRGDLNRITIGRATNVQDGAVLHVERTQALVIGDEVTIGHRAVVHGATIEDRVLVGMGSIIMNGAVVGEGSIVGAGALVTEGTIIPKRSLVLGVPAKVRRDITDEEYDMILKASAHYLELMQAYREGGIR